MNEHDFKNLKNHPELSLSSDERSRMRAYLEALTRKPVVAPVPSPFFVLMFRASPVMAFALLLIVSGGGISAAASGAIPGDVLYAVKTEVNEKVESYLATGVEAKAKVEVKHVEVRLQEAELLAARGTVDEELADTVADKVRDHVARASEAALALSNSGDEEAADDIHTQMSTTLATHAEILDAQAGEAEDESRDVLLALSASVTDTADTIVALLDTSDEHEPTDDTEIRDLALARGARANERVAQLSESLENNGLSSETETELNSELIRIRDDIAATETLMQMEDYVNASNSYEEIERRAYRTLGLVNSARWIGEKTDKEVVIQLASEDELQNEEPVVEETQAATLMMKSAPAEDAANIEAPEDTSERKTFQFRLRTRFGN